MSYRSRVCAELQPVLDAAPIIDLQANLAGARALPIPNLPRCEDVAIATRTIRGPESDLLVNMYIPLAETERPRPGLLYIHGGGLVLGSPDGDGGLCQRFAAEVGCVVVSVDYRLAPEHPFPAAIEDCYAGLRWMADSAASLNVDRTRLAVAGTSSGGGLTAALTLLARDRGGPEIAFQMPLHPMLDDRNTTPSSREITRESMPRAWNRENNIAAWRMYLGAHEDVPISPYAAAARAADLRGLPPAYVCVGGVDLFRDETIRYVTRLAEAGVDVEFHLYPGCFHGFDDAASDTPISERARSDSIAALRRKLG